MAKRGESPSQAETMTEIGEMIHIEHFREIIGLIKGRVNGAVGEEVGGENDNGAYSDEDRDNSYYQLDRSEIPVNSTENGNNDPPK